MRGGDEQVRVILLQDRLRARLMLVPREAVEKENCGCLDPEPLQHAAHPVNVAEPLGQQERGPRALALQDCVEGDGGAVQKEPGGFVGAARLNHPRVDALDQPVWRRQRFAEAQLAGPIIEDGDIRESAADIGGEAKARPVPFCCSASRHGLLGPRWIDRLSLTLYRATGWL